MQEQDLAARKKEAFDKVKSEWKKRSIFQRATERLRGRAPDWKMVSGLSAQELEYIVKVSQGQTYAQIQEDRVSRNAWNSQLSSKEIGKLQEQEHWDSFVDDLMMGPTESSVKVEENAVYRRVK
jgi:hypothetical protein